MNKTKVLIVDDEKYIRETLRIILSDAGYSVLTANGGKEALGIVRTDMVDIVLTDYRMPEMNGVMLMEEVAKIDPTIVTIIMSAYSEIRPAVEALKHGAFDYIEKVFSNEELLFVVSRANEKRKLLEENRILSGVLDSIPAAGNVVAKSGEMQRVLYAANRAAQTSANVLLTGESGVGKDVIAGFIHRMSNRENGPFVAVNCGAIPENLMEAELFGHEEGAYTGAVRSQKGKFEQADGGTLFLDEIGELPLSLQVKLLRAIQEREICRIGSEKGVRVDIRIIAATNRNLENAVAEKLFREDLFYRLNVVNIPIPPLRNRREDIPPLAQQFLREISAEYGKTMEYIDFLAIELLVNYDWPGNVRELRNVIERAVVMAEADCRCLEIKHLENLNSSDTGGTYTGASGKMTLREYEKIIITNALVRNNYNKAKTAEELDIQRQTLYNKMKALGIEDSEA